jgi:hypothetical protein
LYNIGGVVANYMWIKYVSEGILFFLQEKVPIRTKSTIFLGEDFAITGAKER